MSLYYMFNKPSGCITAKYDKIKRTVMEYFPDNIAKNIHPIGRLDKDTHGLLLFTDNGMADYALMRPEHHIEKEYFFYAIGKLDDEKIQRIEEGTYIGDSKITLPAKIEILNALTVKDLKDYFPEHKRKKYMYNPDGFAFSAKLTIHEGRKHQVKLMLRSVNCLICYLKRIRIGDIILDESLAEGDYRELTEYEIASIFK